MMGSESILKLTRDSLISQRKKHRILVYSFLVMSVNARMPSFAVPRVLYGLRGAWGCEGVV